ncbi:MAG: serine/threonine-protein kinase [Myxococcota bacterium]|nr:serine/threonine-protein kinase [Myxococcota bacterium]
MALPHDTELIETLGEGTFGTVYVARVTEGAIQRTVVLKVMKANWVDNEDILSRSKDEAALLARLNHDNIVKVEQLTTLQGRPAVVMEYIRGLTLDVVVKKTGAIPVGVALQIVARVASALGAAYNKIPPGMESPLRVVHRDIKPSNIILSVNGAVKVLDFGTARGEFGEREAETRSVTLGSPRYMAPERFDGVYSGPAIDMYALGVTFFELLGGRSMGRMPLNPERHREKVETALDALRPEKGGGKDLDELLSLIRECLEYDHEKRISAADFRKRALAVLSSLSGGTITLDIYAETVVEPVWEKRTRKAVVPLNKGEGESLLDSPSASASIATGTRSGQSDRSGRSGLSGRSAASSIVVAAGGGRQIVGLLFLGLLVAVGGLLVLKSLVADTQEVPESSASSATAPSAPVGLPGPLMAPPPPEEADIAEEPDAQEPENPAPEESASEEDPEPRSEPDSQVNPSAANAEPSTRPAVPRQPQTESGPTVRITVASNPSKASLLVAGTRYALPQRNLAVPDRTQPVTVEFEDGTLIDCELKPVEGKAYFFRKDNSACP